MMIASTQKGRLQRKFDENPTKLIRSSEVNNKMALTINKSQDEIEGLKRYI